MAIAFDAVAIPSAALYTATFSWTHTPTGTPKGVAVIVVQEANTDQVSGVTYGGVAMTRVRSDVRTATEPGRVYIYFLGSGIPAGAQTVVVTKTGTNDTNAVSLTVTATADSAVDTSNGLDAGIIANPSLSITPTVAAVIFYGIFSGLAAPVTTVETGSTHVAGKDYGTDSAMWARKSVAAGGATTIGYTAASDDVCHSALAIKESANVTATPSTLALVTATFAPVITITQNILVTPDTLAHTITLYSPSAILGTVIVPDLIPLAITTYAPATILGIVVIPSVVALSITTYAPIIDIAAGGTTVTPDTASLTITTYVPAILLPVTVTPSTLALVLAVFAPSVSIGIVIASIMGELILTTYAPTILLAENTLITPNTLALILTTYIPVAGVSSFYDIIQDSRITALEALMDNVAQETSVQTILTRIGIPTSPSISEDLDEIQSTADITKAIERGRWKIENYQLTYYDEDDNILRRFNLFDKNGKPTNENAYERRPV